MAMAPDLMLDSWSACSIGMTSIGSRRRSRQIRTHLSGIAPSTNPTRNATSLIAGILGPGLRGPRICSIGPVGQRPSASATTMIDGVRGGT